MDTERFSTHTFYYIIILALIKFPGITKVNEGWP